MLRMSKGTYYTALSLSAVCFIGTYLSKLTVIKSSLILFNFQFDILIPSQLIVNTSTTKLKSTPRLFETTHNLINQTLPGLEPKTAGR